jgi:hypothetical protein
LAVTKKTVGDGEKLLTYLNSALKALLGFDSFPRFPKRSEILLPSEICKNTHFFHTSLGCHKKTVGDGEKLLTYLSSALKALLGCDMFPLVPKKVKFCCLV